MDCLAKLQRRADGVVRVPTGKRIRRFLSWRRLIVLFILALLAMVATSFYLGRLSALPTPFVSELEDVSSIRRLLVVAPHTDDEALAAGGLMQEVVARGGHVRVAIVTNGDGSFTGTAVEFRKLYPNARDYLRAGAARQQESVGAMELLGVKEEDVVFLGYPDRGILPLWERFWDDAEPYRSPFTRHTQSPYERTFNPNAVYSGNSLVNDLNTVLVDFQPDTVIAPHPADDHPDHWASGAFTALAVSMQREAERPRLLLYLVHRGDYPLPGGYLPFAPILPPLRLVNSTSLWGKVTLEDRFVEKKGQAIELYKSQLFLMGRFLRSFVRQNELFGELVQTRAPLLGDSVGVTPVASQWRTIDGDEVAPVIEDSLRDTLSETLGPNGDFVAMYAGVKDNELWVATELKSSARRLIKYTCLVSAVSDRQVSRASAVFPLNTRARSANEAQDRFLLARFNLQELGYPRRAIASCESRYPGGRLIDRVGWALINLN